ncbi:MAG: hypothetical protein WC294_10880 [Methanoregula sp.]|jgi:hypothetical protein
MSWAKVPYAHVKTPQQINPEELQEYNLTGSGPGIYSGKYHKSLPDLADTLPHVDNKKAFIFSTCGVPVVPAGREFIGKYAAKNHAAIREKLQSKGYTIIDESGCAGFNTNSFLKADWGTQSGQT